MDFPRFTSGQIGRLTFTEVNEILALLERLRPLLQQGADPLPDQAEQMLTARIIGGDEETGAMWWEEVVPKPSAQATGLVEWEKREGGRRSDYDVPEVHSEPAFATRIGPIDPPPLLQEESIVVLRRSKRQDGKPLWLCLFQPAQSAIPAKIISAIPRSTNCWFYGWQAVDLIDGEWQASSETEGEMLGGLAINGAEDCVAPGVGGEGNHPEVNQAIRVGIVVPMHFTPSGKPYFSLSPELEIDCG